MFRNNTLNEVIMFQPTYTQKGRRSKLKGFLVGSPESV